MKTPWKTFFVAASLAAFGLSATAQMGPPPGGHKGQSPERIQARITKHLEELKRKLNINASQEPAWLAFSNAVKPPPAPSAARPNPADLEKLSTPERLDKMKQLHAEHQKAMQPYLDQRDEAIKAFYATLDPAQKAIFDAETARLLRHGHMAH